MIEPILKDIYKGAKTTIPYELYTFTTTGLSKALVRGYTATKPFMGADWTIKDNELVNRVQNNICAFSGAKCYDEMNALRDAVYEDGKLLPFSKFKEKARAINEKYNIQYLEVERQHVMRAGTMGSKWNDIQEDKDLYPYLKYMTQDDERVRESHEKLHGLIFPADDPFWQSYYPPNGWRCRCSVKQLSERDYKHENDNNQMDSEKAQKLAGQSTPKNFRQNVGTTEVFEADGHTYFKASKEAAKKQLSAVKHYGMKSSTDIYGNPAKLAKYKGSINNKDEYNDFWDSYSDKDNKIVLKSKELGIEATFDQELKKKMVTKDRYKYFDEIFNVFEKPDEVWGSFQKSARYNKEMFNTYIRYYNDTPVVMLVNTEGRVDSFYKLDEIKHVEQFRIGVLKHKK